MTIRHANAIKLAMSTLCDVSFFEHILAIYLFGSCARGEESFSSDVDIMVEVNISYVDMSKEERHDFLMLVSELNVSSDTRAAIDLKLVEDNVWNNSNSLFYSRVRRDSICLWDSRKVI